MDNSGRPYRGRQGGWERGATADKAESWRIQDQGRGQNFRSEGGHQGKNQGGPYRASPKKGGLGPMSYSPGGFRGGHSPSQKDDLRWYSGPENSGGSREDNWRERSQQQQQQQQQQHWRRSSQGEGPREDREQGRREATDGSAHKGEDLEIRLWGMSETLLGLSSVKKHLRWALANTFFKNGAHCDSIFPYISYHDHMMYCVLKSSPRLSVSPGCTPSSLTFTHYWFTLCLTKT